VLEGLNVRPGGAYLDATMGEGGHCGPVLEACQPGGRVLGLDADPSVVPLAAQRLAHFGESFRARAGNYADMKSIAGETGIKELDGILFDLGFSSRQIDDAARGFSFQGDGPLDMRFDASQELTAAEIVNNWPEGDLALTIFQYGDEPRARRIATAIARERPVESTSVLASIVAKAIGGSRRKIHAATRTFQALRIRVNRELDNLKKGLESSIDLLATGGRLVVITYHSLEAAIVKSFMRRESGICVCPPVQPVCNCGRVQRLRRITRKAIAPSEQEVSDNPRARSARLRVGERV
jgi:16S rRNA (cytosine1402-N4)-methyltransferase